MGKKKTDEAGASKKGKSAGKDASKDREKVQAPTVSSSLFDTEASSSSSSSAKAKVASYINDIDLPPSDDDEVEEEHQPNQQRRSEAKMLDISMTGKELKKREKKDLLAAHVAELSKREALRDDHDAFTVVIGSRDCEDADANIKDISIEGFSVAVRGKELLKNTEVKISHGKRYGLVGPNGMRKSTLLKLLAWRKIPVPKNIDVLLVEQEVVGDDRSAIEAVVSANEELVKLREDVAALQNSTNSVVA